MSTPYKWNGTFWVPVPSPLAVASSSLSFDTDIATTTTLTLSPTSGKPGTVITLTATVAASPTPTGSVTFERLVPGGTWTAISTDTASPWTASYTLPSTLGTYQFRAKYAGSGSWLPSTSAVKSLTNSAASVTETIKLYATATRSYEQDGTYRSDYYDSRCYHGYYSSTWGQQKSAIWFSVPNNVKGSNVTSMKLRLTRIGSLGDSSITIVCGTHTDASVSSTWDGISGKYTGVDNIPGDAWSSSDNTTDYTLDSNIHAKFEAGAKGILLGPSSSNYCAFHGYVGVSSSERPYLTITYTYEP